MHIWLSATEYHVAMEIFIGKYQELVVRQSYHICNRLEHRTKDGESRICITSKKMSNVPPHSGRASEWTREAQQVDSLQYLPEGRSVVVDCFPVPTLVLQEIGVVVVNLGIVGQSLNSRPTSNA